MPRWVSQRRATCAAVLLYLAPIVASSIFCRCTNCGSVLLRFSCVADSRPITCPLSSAAARTVEAYCSVSHVSLTLVRLLVRYACKKSYLQYVPFWASSAPILDCFSSSSLFPPIIMILLSFSYFCSKHLMLLSSISHAYLHSIHIVAPA